ncbi:MAG: hypothetical protein QM621_09505 [Aeromicrobium sp.]|uniref:hypothetical protein n=1 Tax=Aeromicrobium sp. TaxID=1871063 RepID=UPI0039E63604
MTRMGTKKKISDAEALRRFEEGVESRAELIRDRGATAGIRAAVEDREVSQRRVDDTVIRARLDGLTWVEIASALGVSPQAARQKYMNRV